MSTSRVQSPTTAPALIFALSKFHLFPKLPPEIRRMIWSVSIPGQRVIRVVPHSSSKTMTQESISTYRLIYGAQDFMDHIPTVLLQICKESRTFALERYKPFLGGPWGDLPLYFDFVGDTLFFNDNLEWKFMTDISVEERKAEKEEHLRLAAELEAMVKAIAENERLARNPIGEDGDTFFVLNDWNTVASMEDDSEIDGTGYEGDLDSLFGDGGSEDSMEGTDGDQTERVTSQNYQQEDDEYGSDLDSLFGEGRYADRYEEIPQDHTEEGNWDDWDFLYGYSENKVPKVKKWKEELRFLAFGGETCPDHKSLAPFTTVLKVTIERGRAFGLTDLMRDHLLQAFKKGRRVEHSAELPIIQFVNRVV
ncbi:hypothetical protein N431DRAFT_543445 [Stipitochalara longipes BDJ]|nr:hypothetical protein N431DRAFT_543445 [Stipitochalara longipes BDJ]